MPALVRRDHCRSEKVVPQCFRRYVCKLLLVSAAAHKRGCPFLKRTIPRFEPRLSAVIARFGVGLLFCPALFGRIVEQLNIIDLPPVDHVVVLRPLAPLELACGVEADLRAVRGARAGCGAVLVDALAEGTGN